MNRRNFRIPLSKILFLFVLLLLIFYLIDFGSLGYYYTNRGSNTIHYSTGHGTGAKVVALTSSALMCVYVIAFLKRNKNSIFPIGMRISVYSLIILSVLWSIITVMTDGIRGLLGATTSPYVYLLCAAVFLGADEKIWEQARKAALYIGFGCLLMSLYYILRSMARWGFTSGNSPQIIYLSAGFFPFSIWALLTDEKSKLEKIISYLGAGIAIFISVMYATRGWTVQGIVLLVAIVIKENSGKKSYKSVLLIPIILLISSIFIYFILMTYFPSYLNRLIGRLFNDSRSAQYREIFRDVTLFDVVFGKGMKATYVSAAFGNYSYIDNTFVYLIFHYGLFYSLSYLMLFLFPIFRIFKSMSATSKNAALILTMYFLGLNGLSVFFVPMLDIKSLYVFLLMGHCYKVTAPNAYRNKKFGTPNGYTMTGEK